MNITEYRPFDLYDRDAAAMRQLVYSDQDAERARYAAMTLAEQRAYAAAHPTFTHHVASDIPAWLGFQMSDARIAGDHALASRLMSEHMVAQNKAEVAEILASTYAPFGYRLFLAFAYAIMGAVPTAACAGVGYLAGGLHGAAIAAALPGAATCFVILARLAGSRS